MDSPVYKLEHVVHSREGMEDFEGPLDLILFLLSRNKIEIQDIPIALILDQYLAYLDRWQRMDLEITSEFIIMAAQLMFIKTRMLLSIEDAEAQSEMEELIKSLEERRSSESYTKIKSITERFAAMAEFGRDIMLRPPEAERGKVYVYSHLPEDLPKAMREVMEREARKLPPPLKSFSDIVGREPYPVAGKAEEIMARLNRLGAATLRRLLRGSKSRSEVVAAFLAVLELCRARAVRLTVQPGGGECVVTPTGEGTGNLNL